MTSEEGIGIVAFFSVILLICFNCYLAKKKGRSVGWTLLGSLFLLPMVTIYLLIRKKSAKTPGLAAERWRNERTGETYVTNTGGWTPPSDDWVVDNESMAAGGAEDLIADDQKRGLFRWQNVKTHRKGISFCLLVLGGIVTKGIAENGTISSDWSPACFIGAFCIVVYGSLVKAYKSNVKKKCAFCDSFKIEFKSGEEGGWIWQFRNNDGSPDKRVKDNYQQAGYTSIYECGECTASTQFEHLVNRKPGKDAKIWSRTLINMPSDENERTGSDWINEGVVSIDSNSANRKNN
jgi:hypothetical protein